MQSLCKFRLPGLFRLRTPVCEVGFDSVESSRVGLTGNPVQVLEEHVPSFVLSLFEDRLKECICWKAPNLASCPVFQDQGLGLHELTVLAATLEHLIHDEALDASCAVLRVCRAVETRGGKSTFCCVRGGRGWQQKLTLDQ